jgi:uncharacterized protein YjdB
MKPKYFLYFLAAFALLFSTCKKEIPVAHVWINSAGEPFRVGLGDTLQLTVTVQPENATNKKVTWNSTNKKVATINDNGMVIGIAIGETMIQVFTEDGNKEYNSRLFVVDKVPVTGVTLKTTLVLALGESETLTATIEPDDATNINVTWKSSNAAVATVTDKGKVTALTEGNAIITVTTKDGNFTANCNLSVVKEIIPATGITLNTNELILVPGETKTLIATIHPNNATNQEVTWTSNIPWVATVTDNGLVTAISQGSSTITVTTKDGNRIAHCYCGVDDYRTHWIGSYNCEKVLKNGLPKQVTIDVSASGDSSLFFSERNLQQYEPGLYNFVRVRPDGRFSTSYKGEGFGGKFIQDSIFIDYVVYSPSFSLIYHYTGKKIKN